MPRVVTPNRGSQWTMRSARAVYRRLPYYSPHSACPVADFGYFAFAMRAVLTAIRDVKSEFKASFASWRCRQETSAVVPAARRCMRFSILGSLRHQGCSSVETTLFSGFPQKSQKCTKCPCGMWARRPPQARTLDRPVTRFRLPAGRREGPRPGRTGRDARRRARRRSGQDDRSILAHCWLTADGASGATESSPRRLTAEYISRRKRLGTVASSRVCTKPLRAASASHVGYESG
jgi:hypothetical protein